MLANLLHYPNQVEARCQSNEADRERNVVQPLLGMHRGNYSPLAFPFVIEGGLHVAAPLFKGRERAIAFSSPMNTQTTVR